MARGMIKMALEKDVSITIKVDAGISINDSETIMKSNGIKINAGRVDPRIVYDNKSSDVKVSNQTDHNAQLTFIHELGHGLSWNLGHFNRLLFSDSYLPYNIQGRKDVLYRYMEAVAITLYNTVSDELNWNLQQAYTREGHSIDNEYDLHPDGPEIYGAFPFEYTNGKAASIKSLGPEIAEWYRLQEWR